MTEPRVRVSIGAMSDRVVCMVLAVVLVIAGGSAPFAHVHPHGEGDGVDQRADVGVNTSPPHDHARGAHWHPVGSHAAERLAITISRGHHRHLSVPLDALAVERPNVRIGVAPALVETWTAQVMLDPPFQSASVGSNARAQPPPSRLVTARAPPL